MRYAGARVQLTVRADSNFYTQPVIQNCRKSAVRFSVTLRQNQNLGNLIEAIPESEWTSISNKIEGVADVAVTEYSPFKSEPDAALVRSSSAG